MLDAIQTSSMSASAVQSPLQVQQPPVSPDRSVDQNTADPSYSKFSIRMDNQLDMAIIEVRSSETGDVMRHYTTERQIAYYQRVAELEDNNDQPQQSVSTVENNAATLNSLAEGGGTAYSASASLTSDNSMTSVTRGMGQFADTSSVAGQSYLV